MTRIILIAALVSSSIALAQDCEGCKDHPAVARFPGFSLESAEQNDFNSFEFPVGEEKTKAKEGPLLAPGLRAR